MGKHLLPSQIIHQGFFFFFLNHDFGELPLIVLQSFKRWEKDADVVYETSRKPANSITIKSFMLDKWRRELEKRWIIWGGHRAAADLKTGRLGTSWLRAYIHLGVKSKRSHKAAQYGYDMLCSFSNSFYKLFSPKDW